MAYKDDGLNFDFHYGDIFITPQVDGSLARGEAVPICPSYVPLRDQRFSAEKPDPDVK